VSAMCPEEARKLVIGAAVSGRAQLERSSSSLLFRVDLANRQSCLPCNDLDEDVAGSPGQVQGMQPFPDFDALARILDGRRLGFELTVALGCAFLRRAQHFLAMIRGASRRRGHELIGDSRIHPVLTNDHHHRRRRVVHHRRRRRAVCPAPR
jgi:hypothetical protein